MSLESKKKRKETLVKINHQQGLNNSQYGTIWITDGTKEGSCKIKRGEEIPNGYKPGRVLK